LPQARTARLTAHAFVEIIDETARSDAETGG
jgi:hypothetical protein